MVRGNLQSPPLKERQLEKRNWSLEDTWIGLDFAAIGDV